MMKREPTLSIVLLPNLLKRYPVMKVANTCSKLINEGINEAISPLVACEAILPPYTATPLIPENCCMMAR